VATFTDIGGDDPASDYVAIVAWGDGTAPDPATVQLNGGGFQVVSAVAHTYKDEGSYIVAVTIQDKGTANPRAIVATTTATGSVSVSDAPLTPVALAALPTQPKGVPLAGVTVASFTDAHPSALVGDFTAMIDWGDGSPTTFGTVFQPGGLGAAFVIQGTHTYGTDRATPYTITVTIADMGGRRVIATTTATVADAAPLATGIPVKMTAGIAFTAPVADILENIGLPPEPAGHYTATINWGDATASTTGIVAAIPGGNWVVGSHTYAGSGPYTITVTVHDDGGFTVIATTTAYDPPAGSGAAGPSATSGGGSVSTSPTTPVAPHSGPAGPLHHRHRRTSRPELNRHHPVTRPARSNRSASFHSRANSLVADTVIEKTYH
jgi:hypothetical protein